MKKIAAGVVLYNPNLEILKENVSSIINQVDKILLVDNNSCNIADIEKEFCSDKIQIINNKKNYGIAFALNQIVQGLSDYDWVLTLDQDTIVPDDIIIKYVRYLETEGVALVCPRIIDRNNMHDSVTNRKICDNSIDVISKCITSASILNVEICMAVGLFDDKMFIDLVDFEYCQRLCNKGFKILRINDVSVIHQLGNMKVYNIFGIHIHVTNHPKERVYYYARNSLYFYKKHREHLKISHTAVDLIKLIMKIILFESNKKGKLYYFSIGIIDGINNKMGQIRI